MTTKALSSADGTSASAVESLLAVCFPDATTIFDPTYGSGMFYKGSERKVWGGDMNPDRAKTLVGSYTAIPLLDNSVDVVIFDPPFQPSTSHKTEGVISKRFTTVRGTSGDGHGAGALAQLKEDVQIGALEAMRVSRLGFIIKVQDYIHDHKPVWMSMWLWEVLGEPYDFMTVRAASKLIAPNWTRQLSVWRNHSTYWVYRPDAKNNTHKAWK